MRSLRRACPRRRREHAIPTPVIPAKAGIHLRPPRSVTGNPPSPSLTTAGPLRPKPHDTVASALYRSGQRIFSRSFKYHRPRGLLCAAGRCPNCMMNVDGTPNVRACTQPVQDGMQVTHQNAYPSLESDFMAVAERFAWAMPVGFYYKTFTHPWMWHLAEPLIRRAAGLGKIDRDPRAGCGPPVRARVPAHHYRRSGRRTVWDASRPQRGYAR